MLALVQTNIPLSKEDWVAPLKTDPPPTNATTLCISFLILFLEEKCIYVDVQINTLIEIKSLHMTCDKKYDDGDSKMGFGIRALFP